MKILKPRHVRPGKNHHNQAIETAGEVFSDGTVLELISSESEEHGTELLRWDGKSAIVGHELEVHRKRYRPSKVFSSLRPAIRLPGRVAPYGSTRDLLDSIINLLKRYTDTSEDQAWLTTFFVLGSWLADRLDLCPFLSVVAPLGAPRAQFLRLLNCLCRRPISLAEVTPAAIASLAYLGPTFIIDEPHLNRRTEQFLYTSNAHSRSVLAKGRMLNSFSAKIICSHEPLHDSFLASQALLITLSPDVGTIPFLDAEMCDKIAVEFQAKLFAFRLKNVTTIRFPEIDVSGLAAPIRDQARAYGACVGDDKELQLGVVDLLRERDIDLRLDYATQLESVILEALLFCCHRAGRSRVLSGELADIVNRIWAERGEGRRTTPESVGRRLRSLGLRTEPIDGEGKGLRLTEADRARIHSLARAYRVPSMRSGIDPECAHCKAVMGS